MGVARVSGVWALPCQNPVSSTLQEANLAAREHGPFPDVFVFEYCKFPLLCVHSRIARKLDDRIRLEQNVNLAGC